MGVDAAIIHPRAQIHLAPRSLLEISRSLKSMWSLFKSNTGTKGTAPSESKIDRLTYAVGDIHGCSDLFSRLLNTIQDDAERTGEKPRIVLLGDYIDRGPNSSRVLDQIVGLRNDDWCDCVPLLGNHELVFREFLTNSDKGPELLAFGVAATFASYGISVPKQPLTTDDWLGLRRSLVKVMPTDHIWLLSQCALKFIAGDYLFVHAGVKPGMPIEDQGTDTLVWIRKEFLSKTKSCDYVVVHGHSAKEAATNNRWRIGVDTGAYATGVLTAIRLQDTSRAFLQASR